MSLAHISPIMVGAPLDQAVPRVEDSFFSRVQTSLDCPLNDDRVVQALCSVHGQVNTWWQIQEAKDRAVVDGKARCIVEIPLVRGDVSLSSEVGRELICGVSQRYF